MRRRARSASPTSSTKVRASTSSASTSSATMRTQGLRHPPRVPPGGRRCLQPAAWSTSAKKRLQGLGLFKTVEVKRRPGSAPDRVVLDVEVVEQSTGELSFGAGYSTSEGVIGDVSHHRAQPARQRPVPAPAALWLVRAPAGRPDFTEPRFLDRNLAAGFDLFHKQRRLFSKQAGFEQQHDRRLGSPGFPLAENLWMQTHYTISRDEIFNVANNASAAIKEACGASGAACVWAAVGELHELIVLTSLVGTSLSYDKRNNAEEPDAVAISLQVDDDFAGLGGDVAVLARQCRGSRLLSGHREDHVRRSRSSAATSRAGAARMSACSTSSSKVARRSAASTCRLSVRAT